MYKLYKIEEDKYKYIYAIYISKNDNNECISLECDIKNGEAHNNCCFLKHLRLRLNDHNTIVESFLYCCVGKYKEDKTRVSLSSPLYLHFFAHNIIFFKKRI